MLKKAKVKRSLNKKLTIDHLEPSQLIHPSEREPVPPVKKRSKRFRFFFILFRLTRLFIGNAALRLRGDKNSQLCEKRIIECLQGLGMLWIRVAQALSLRGEVLSTSYGLRLLDLHDKGGSHPFSQIRPVIEKELSHPIEDVFDRFEEKPFAATTVSQIHRARLRDEQVWAAVKIQQPQAEDIFNQDLKILRRLIQFLKLFSIQSSMRWEELYHELEEIKTRELNYYYEAASLETLENNLQNQPVHVPKVYRRYCRQRLLVMEFIQGALLSDYIEMRHKDPIRLDNWLKNNNIDPRKVARRLFHSVYRQVFEDNFFHGDMHTGNIILLKDSRLAFIECRSAGSLELESLKKQEMFLHSLSEREYVTAAEIYFLLASRLPRVDLNTVKEKLVREWRVWETRTYVDNLPYEQKSMAYMTGRVNRIVYDSQFAPLWSFVKVTCTWVHLDNSIAHLYPRLNYSREMNIYFRIAQGRENRKKLLDLPTRIAEAVGALQQLPRRTSEYTLFRETLMRRQSQVVQGSASKLEAVISAGFGFISFFLMTIASFLLLVFAQRHLAIPLHHVIGQQLSWLADQVPAFSLVGWGLILSAFLFLYIFFRRQKNQFKRIEYGESESNSVY